MSHLGSFGAAVRELDPTAEKDTFDFFGEKFEVVDVVPPMLALQLGAATSGKIAEQEGLAALWETMRVCLTRPAAGDKPADDEQFTRYYKLAVGQRCDLDELMRLALTLFEQQTGRPTEEPSGSSAGQSPTSPSSSTSSSPSQDSLHMVPVTQVLGG